MLHTLHIVAHLTYCCTPYILLHTLNIVAHINFTPGMFSPTPPLQSGHAKRKSTHQAVNGRIAPSAKHPCSRCNATLHQVQGSLAPLYWCTSALRVLTIYESAVSLRLCLLSLRCQPGLDVAVETHVLEHICVQVVDCRGQDFCLTLWHGRGTAQCRNSWRRHTTTLNNTKKGNYPCQNCKCQFFHANKMVLYREQNVVEFH